MGKDFVRKTDFTIWFADPVFPIQCTTFVQLRLQKIGDFLTKNYILQWKFLNFGDGVENLWTSAKKAHPYAKSGRINRLAYVPVVVFWRYRTPRKKHARTVIGKSLGRYHAAVINQVKHFLINTILRLIFILVYSYKTTLTIAKLYIFIRWLLKRW